MNPKAFIGIDPGASGAVALLTTDGESMVADYPGDAVSAADLLRQWRADHRIELVALELVHALPKQGVSSMFKLGANFGAWLGILAALGIPHVLIRPQEWQRGTLSKGDGPDTKSQSLAAARRRWPDLELSRKKDHGRADALHLANHARNLEK